MSRCRAILYVRLPERLSPQPKNEDSGTHRIRNIEGGSRGTDYALSVALDHFQPAHIGLQHIGNGDRAVFLLVGFHHSDQCAADGGAGAVQSMHEARLAVGPAIARIHAPRLEIATYRAARDFAVGPTLAVAG